MVAHKRNYFDDHQFHELDLINIAKLGRQWFGESFDIKQDQEFEFNFPNIDVSTPVKLKQLQLLQLIPRLLFRLL
jgi:hypothetical protein